MIVRETKDHYVMTTQHDHALVSGEISRWFPESMFGNDRIQEVVLAIEQHDRGWIRLDETPIWNDRQDVPFSFMDYPLPPKLLSYRQGIDEVEEMNKYAGLLCSLHYSSFNHIKNSSLKYCVEFREYETERQNRIKHSLGIQDDKNVWKHYHLLQLCDRLSLYFCMNEPGVTKEDEYESYRDGFQFERRIIQARWVDETNIVMDPFLFVNDFHIRLKSKHVPKESIKQTGIADAYQATPWTELEIKISSGI